MTNWVTLENQRALLTFGSWQLNWVLKDGYNFTRERMGVEGKEELQILKKCFYILFLKI